MEKASQKPLVIVSLTTRWILLLGLPLLGLMFGLRFYINSGSLVETENAYVKADIIAVAPEIAGRVLKVWVIDGQQVKKGDELFRTESLGFELSRDKAAAKMEVVKTEVLSLQAEYRAMLLNREEAMERVKFFKTKVKRYSSLRERGMIRADVFDEAQHELQVARTRLKAIREKINKILASLNGNPDLSPKLHPRFLEAKAVFDRAEIDILETRVLSPVDGTLVNMKLQVGEYVERGADIFSIVSSDPIWIEANYKETQLTNMKIGQTVKVIADAYPDMVWDGEIELIAQATGAEFALLPPQNATGNWIKVVQRVPVRIKVDRFAHDAELRVGMTATVSVETGTNRGLPPILRRFKDHSWFPEFLYSEGNIAKNQQ